MTVLHLAGRYRSAHVSVLIAIFLCVFSPQVFAASNGVVQDDSDAEMRQGSTESPSPPATSNVGSIEDLFRDYSEDLSRLSATYDLIGTADEAKLVDLFDQAIKRKYTQQDRAWKSELISLISSQLAPINLNKAISLYDALTLDDAKYMLYGLMHAWASKDFEGAVEFARKQDTSIHSIALRGIVDANLSLPATTLRELGREFGDVEYVERALTARQMELDLADPDKAWASLINDPTIHREENFDRVKYVANALIDKYGVAEAEKLLDSISGPALRFGLSKSILTKIALTEPDTAFNFALDISDDVFGTLLTTVIDIWANTDPKSALARVRLLERSRVRGRLEQEIVSSWVLSDLEKFTDSFDSIPIELQDTARLSLIKQLAKNSIADAVTLLPDITDLASQEEAAISIVDSWIESDPDALFHWILSSPENERYRSRLLSSFLEKLTRTDANHAFDLALSHPIVEETAIGLEVVVIDNLHISDSDHALDLLSRVRPGETQLVAFESVARGLIHDKRTAEAIELGKRLSEEQQQKFFKNIATSLVTQETPKKILEILPKVPGKEAQSKIAESVLLFGVPFSKAPLSEGDVESFLKYVTPSKLQEVNLILRIKEER